MLPDLRLVIFFIIYGIYIIFFSGYLFLSFFSKVTVRCLASNIFYYETLNHKRSAMRMHCLKDSVEEGKDRSNNLILEFGVEHWVLSAFEVNVWVRFSIRWPCKMYQVIQATDSCSFEFYLIFDYTDMGLSFQIINVLCLLFANNPYSSYSLMRNRIAKNLLKVLIARCNGRRKISSK